MEDNLKQYAQLHDENIELKKEIERLKGESEWISVNDRLPENEQVVDIWKYDSYRDEYYRVTNHKYENRYIIEFSHWMSLPKNPL